MSYSDSCVCGWRDNSEHCCSLDELKLRVPNALMGLEWMKCSLGEILCFILRCISNPSQNKLNFEHYVKTFKESRAGSFPVEQRWAGGKQDAALRCCVLEGRPARKQTQRVSKRTWRWFWSSKLRLLFAVITGAGDGIGKAYSFEVSYALEGFLFPLCWIHHGCRTPTPDTSFLITKAKDIHSWREIFSLK